MFYFLNTLISFSRLLFARNFFFRHFRAYRFPVFFSRTMNTSEKEPLRERQWAREKEREREREREGGEREREREREREILCNKRKRTKSSRSVPFALEEDCRVVNSVHGNHFIGFASSVVFQ